MKLTRFACLLVVAVAFAGAEARVLAAEGAGAAPGRVGAIARDFTVVDRATRQPLRLADLAGKIVVLDFFAHWCAPCRTASADLERNVRQHYAARGGNPAGLPVVVLAINIDLGNEPRTAEFVRAAGIELAADDTRQEAFRQFDDRNVVPLLVVVNAAAGAPGQVVYRRSGYEGAAALRKAIDGIGAPRPAK